MSGIIYDFTGNPFVDAGIWALSQWVGKKPEELDKSDLKSIADVVTDLYLTEKWSKAIYSIFPNNPIINPSFKGKIKKKEIYSQFLEELIEKTTVLKTSGDCIACGRRNIQFIDSNGRSGSSRFAKDKIPLCGSKSMVNYFSYGADGADYCPACAFAAQLSPLVLYSCVNLLLLHSNSDILMKIWSKHAIDNIRKQINSNNYTGCFDEGYKNQKNAIFRILGVIHSITERGIDLSADNPSVDFYYFTNYIQNPDLDIYHIPSPIFKFIYMAVDISKADWMKIVKRGYVNVDFEKMNEKEYRNKPNLVYNYLLDSKSIIKFFIDKQKRKALGGWDLLRCYLKEVRNMDENRIKTIKKVGDELAEYIKSSDDIKTLKKLETANNYRNYRNILRIIIKKRIKNGADEPLFSFDDYVKNLFPEGNLTWRETQDLILFRIYEVLHDWIIQQGVSEELSINEDEEEAAENV
jgi:CRISPR-associated protein Cst1